MEPGADPPTQARPPARRGPAVLLLLLLLASHASAQVIELRAGATSAGPVARLGWSEVPHAGGTLGLAAVFSPAPGLDLDARTARAVGGIGTLTFDVAGGFRAVPSLRARLRLGARGTIGPVAGRIEASAWSAAPERFDPLADPGPVRGAAGIALLVDADYRLDGRWLLGTTARVERSGGGTAFDASLDARARRLLGPDLDLTGRLGTRLADGGDGRLALAAGVVHAPRRRPEMGVSAHLDLAPTEAGVAFAPGLESYGARTVAGGRIGWSLRLRPFAPDRAPWLVELDWAGAAGTGTLTLRTLLAHGHEVGTLWGASLGYELPFDPR